MTTARSVLLSAIIVAAAMLVGAWMIVRNQPAPERYQLVNVGRGETQRIDKLTGTVTRCSYGKCEALTEGEKIIEKPAEKPGGVATPPSGYTLDD